MALGQLDVGYRPLTPADDVAGLAGQRQALGEFSAASADTAREIAAGQAVVESTLRAHDTFTRLAQSAQKLALDRQQVAHTMNMEREELSMQQSLMPGKVEAMSLQNEAMRIDNKYAEAEEQASITGQRLQNEARMAELEAFGTEQNELASLARHEQALRKWVSDGYDVDDYTGPTVTSAKAMAAWKQIVASVRATNAAKREDAIQDSITKKLQTLNGKQLGILKATDSAGNLIYTDAQGNLNDEGEDVIDRISRMNALTGDDMNSEDRKMLMENAKGVSRGMIAPGGLTGQEQIAWAKEQRTAKSLAVLDNGVLVPTEAGLTALKKRKADREPDFRDVEREQVVVDDKLVWKHKQVAVADSKAKRRAALYKDYLPQIEAGLMTEREAAQKADQREVEENTLHVGFGQQQGSNLEDIARAIRHERRILRHNADGTVTRVTLSGGSVVPEGEPATGTGTGTGTGSGKHTPSSISGQSVENIAARAFLSRSQINKDILPGGRMDLTQNIDYPVDGKGLNGEVEKEEYDKLMAANQGDHYDTLTGAYDFDKTGYIPEHERPMGMDDATAKEIIALAHQLELEGKSGWGQGLKREGTAMYEGGFGHASKFRLSKWGKNTQQMVYAVIDSYADSMSADRDKIAESLGMDFKFLKSWGDRREADEITTELLVKDKAILKLMASEDNSAWYNKKIMIPWQEEVGAGGTDPRTRRSDLGDLGRPVNIFGHNHLSREGAEVQGTKVEYKSYTFTEGDTLKIDVFRKAFKKLQLKQQLLERMAKGGGRVFLSKSASASAERQKRLSTPAAKTNPWPHTLTSKERQAIRDRQRKKELDWSNR